MHSAQAQAEILPSDLDLQAVDLSELDDESYQRFMKQLLADLARQRRIARAWRLPTLVMPGGACAMA